jgi:hypothetical protein
MDPVRWAYFQLKTGQHPGFVLVPRMEVEMPKETSALRRRGPSLPDANVTFVIEHRLRKRWTPLPGDPYSVLTGACAATEAVEMLRDLGALRIVRYIDNIADQVVHGACKKHDQPSRASFSLRCTFRLPTWSRSTLPSSARSSWRR